MTTFQVIALLSALCSLQSDAFSLRADNPFLPAHRRLASCPTTSGVDYLGNDIKHVSGVQVSDCCTLCSQTTTCGAFTWTSFQGGTCWLKSAKGNTVANAAATSAVLITDSPGCTLKDGVDYQDNDIANVRSANPGNCCSICSAWPGCNAFSWSNFEGGTCWLKSKKGTEISKPGVKSAEIKNTVDQCNLQYDVDFVDNDIANVPGKSPSTCCDICNNYNGCRSFSWSNYNGGTCWLKSAKGQTVPRAGVVSSQLLDNAKSGCTLEVDVDYIDNDIGNVLAAQSGDCCHKCLATVGCHAFSWSNHNGGTCWLKSRKGGIVPKSGVTSGVVL